MSFSEDLLQDQILRHVRTDFARLLVDQTVGKALASIRTFPGDSQIVYFYVVDNEDRLVGVVPARRLLLSALDTPLREVMVDKVIAIPATATVLEACEYFVMHRRLAFPVVDAQRRLVGMVDVELYAREMNDLDRSERSEELFQLIGVHITATQQTSVVTQFRTRFPWLLCNIAGGIVAAFLGKFFEKELERVVAIALFIPVVLALAESVSIQSVSLALALLHGTRPTLASLGRKLRGELLTGAFLGLASGATVALVALAWLGEPRMAGCLLLGIAGGVTCAAVVGVALPNLLRLLKRDPGVAAGPIALAAADMLTLVWYLNLTRWLLT